MSSKLVTLSQLGKVGESINSLRWWINRLRSFGGAHLALCSLLSKKLSVTVTVTLDESSAIPDIIPCPVCDSELTLADT